MIILKILKILLFAVLGLLAFVLLLLCLPVTVLMRYESAGGEFELTVRYLFIPVRLLPKDERSLPYKLDRLKERSEARREKKELARIRFRNAMLQRGMTRAVYRFFEERAKARERRRLERKRKKLEARKKQRKPAAKKEKSAFGKLLEERGVCGMVSWILELARIAGGMLRKTFRGIIIRRLDLMMDVGGEDAAQAAINYGRMCAILLPALSLIRNCVRRYRRNIRLSPDFDGEGIKALLDTELVIIPIAVAGHALMALLRVIAGEVGRRIRENMSRAAAGG